MRNPFAAVEWRVRRVRGLYFIECRRWLLGWCYITLRNTRYDADEFIRLEQAKARGLSEV